MQQILAIQVADHLDRQTLPAELVKHRQHADLAACVGTVFDEVVGPDMIPM